MAKDSRTGEEWKGVDYTLAPKKPLYKKPYPNLGSIVLSRNYAFVGCGRKDFTVSYSHVSISRQEVIFFTKQINPSERVFNALMKLSEFAPKLDSLVVSSFGPYQQTSGNQTTLSGRFETFKSLGIWKDFELQRAVHRCLEKLVSIGRISHFPSAVSIEHDVSMAALGEHYEFLKRSYYPTDALDLRDDRFTSAYVKISNDVNVGIMSNMTLLRGRHTPQYNHIRPSPMIYGELDAFTGCCAKHGDGYGGIISTHGVEVRSRYNWKQVSNDAPCWDIIAFYIAELCMNLILSFSPKRIALAGKVINGPSNYEAGWKKLIDKIRFSINYHISRYPHLPEVSLYKEMENLETFIDYRVSRYPALFGGLIKAHRQLQVHGEGVDKVINLHT